ncbi:LLM class F420-dependent oxidoreductase [Embleya sp. AB8]|uniref:LLM class F420-dependent oxidoreductase n=1 Tax=Embleya sp. AB8 TaxID=3156304 RepID=UPI003C7480BD
MTEGLVHMDAQQVIGRLGRIGVWEHHDTFVADTADPGAVAAELEELGFTAAWVGGAPADGLFGLSEQLLAGSRRLGVASGILNIRAFPVADTIAGVAALEKGHPGRFVLGLGVSHPEFADRTGVEYTPPVAAMNAYLDALDADADPAVPRVLAALGPRMQRLSRDRAQGAHPYFTTPAHTREARETLGEGVFLAPEQKVVLSTDPEVARAVIREASAFYLGLDNYRRSWLRLGFTEDDLADGGSDRLVDALVVWGDEETIAARIREHLDAGADHVSVHVLPTDAGHTGLPHAEWARLAPALRDL